MSPTLETWREAIAGAFPFRNPRLHPPTCACSDCVLIAAILDALTRAVQACPQCVEKDAEIHRLGDGILAMFEKAEQREQALAEARRERDEVNHG